jgi:hypothetical protein
MKKKYILFFVCAMFYFFCSLKADVEEIAWGKYTCPYTGKKYVYTTYRDDCGEVWTSWRCDICGPCNCNTCMWTKSNNFFSNDKIRYTIDLYENLLFVTANSNINAKVYELLSGKLVKNVSIIKDYKVIINNIENNKYYLISIKMPDGSYQRQTFFIHNNQLFKGGKYEK